MDNYYIEKIHEVISNTLEKSPDELLEFLRVHIDDSHTAEVIIREFKYNLSMIKRKYESKGDAVGIKL